MLLFWFGLGFVVGATITRTAFKRRIRAEVIAVINDHDRRWLAYLRGEQLVTDAAGVGREIH